MNSFIQRKFTSPANCPEMDSRRHSMKGLDRIPPYVKPNVKNILKVHHQQGVGDATVTQLREA